MSTDRFGNPLASDLPYARGRYITSTADDIRKVRAAGEIIRHRTTTLGPESIYLLSGLERRLNVDPDDLSAMDDELASALYSDEVTELGLEHLGGNRDEHDVVILNRLTSGLLLAADILLESGQRVVGVSPRYSHPAVVRAVAHARAHFEDAAGLAEFKTLAASSQPLDAVFLTRLAVSYEILGEAELREVVGIAREKGAYIIVDDAGGARVGPAIFDQPKTLELGVDVGATGLDKYGTSGPRLGLLGGRRDVVERIRTRAFEMGLEARQMLFPAVVRSLKDYRPERVQELVACTKSVGDALKSRVSANRLFETPVTVQLRAEDILELAMERGKLSAPPVVPYEATAGLAMLLLRDYGVVTVHFAGIPPGTSALMIKFVPPETLERFGGPEALADAIDRSLTRLGETLQDEAAFAALLTGGTISDALHPFPLSPLAGRG